MGTELWKETLLPGRYRDRYGNWFAYSRRQIAQAHRNVSRMLSRGLNIPCVWEHVGVEENSPDDVKARFARHTFGHITGSRINGRGALELRHHVRDPRDAEQLLKTRFVSPKVYPGYSDSRGGEYRGTTIGHVAATGCPVQFNQVPFAELSRGKALFLSYTPEDAMADDADDDKGGKKGGDDEPKKSSGSNPAGGKKTLDDVIQALRDTGMNIPDEVTDETGLVIAIKASGGAAVDDDDTDDLDDLAGGGSPTTPAGGAPMLMSDKRAEPFRKMTRRDLATRVDKLFTTGRIDRPTAAKLKGEVKAVELSFTTDGDLHRNPLADRIKAYESLPKHMAWKPTGEDGRELSVTEMDAPDELTGAKTGEDAVVKEQERLAALHSVKR